MKLVHLFAWTMLFAVDKLSLADSPVPNTSKSKEVDEYSGELAPKELQRMCGLVRLLKDSDAEIHTQAFTQLMAIGPRVLKYIERCLYQGDAELTEHVYKLYHALQVRHGVQKVLVNNLLFDQSCDSSWKLPLPGKSCNVKIEVAVTNQSNEKVIVFWPETIRFSLCDTSGKASTLEGTLQYQVPTNPKSPPLAFGERFVVSRFSCTLNLASDQADAWLAFSDGVGGRYRYAGLHKGFYMIRAHYVSRNRDELVTVNLPPMVVAIE